MRFVIPIENDQPDYPGVALKVGGVIGQEEWTWLTPLDAGRSAGALVTAGVYAHPVEEGMKLP